MTEHSMIIREMITAAAAAIANTCGGRRGAPEISNIFRILPHRLRDEARAHAQAVLRAAGDGAERAHRPRVDGGQ
ncbi:hypothetical protein [Methylobacterium oryzisoli]|uniref:hypothetical protein n=1 Tax=Methylobacterium oryzisoli TaxID=3385502 RepID=UPI003892967E